LAWHCREKSPFDWGVCLESDDSAGILFLPCACGCSYYFRNLLIGCKHYVPERGSLVRSSVASVRLYGYRFDRHMKILLNRI
jgi:hypothetical protein